MGNKNTTISNIKVTLSDIPSKHILWAYHKKGEDQYLKEKDIKKIISLNGDNSVTVQLSKDRANKLTKIQKWQIINNAMYFDEICSESFRKCKERGIRVDKSKIFKFYRLLQRNK